ncbi:proteasome-interacting protein cic1 [Coemansia biformis]|uniref:Ribosomal L1 domain-containing protein 1 n=1 Tax=Coemansia biformis TaxID=1286918 RepID=A0A9W7YF44_9FUNG|nr:proteasome-interacting protein cic1 [Coemansia biformis]
MSLSHDLVLRASESLLKYAEKQQEKDAPTNLLADEEQPVHLIVSVKKLALRMQHKPYRIPLKTPLYGESSSVCLFTKNNDEAHIEKLQNLKIPQIKAIVSMAQLKTEYKAYEARRLLLSTHDLFLTDDRVIAALPEALGVKFFKAKKLPAPVNLKATNLKNEMEKALSCTYFRQNKGTCNALKVGMTSMSASDLADNIVSAADMVAKCIPKGWDNIQSVGIKTGTSLTLPVYNALPNGATAIGDSGAVLEEVAQDEEGEGAKKRAKKQKSEDASADAAKAKKSRKSPLSRSKADSLVKAYASKRAATKA